MKRSHLLAGAVLSIGAAFTARAATKVLADIGDLSDEMALGYASSNAVPVAGQQAYSDTSGVDHPYNRALLRPRPPLFTQAKVS